MREASGRRTEAATGPATSRETAAAAAGVLLELGGIRRGLGSARVVGRWWRRSRRSGEGAGDLQLAGGEGFPAAGDGSRRTGEKNVKNHGSWFPPVDLGLLDTLV